MSAEVVKLNIGGTYFSTSLSTLQRYPTSTLGIMFTSQRRDMLPRDADGCIFLDRSGKYFEHILQFLRTPNPADFFYPVDLNDREKAEFDAEVCFYKLEAYMDLDPLVDMKKDVALLATRPTAATRIEVSIFRRKNGAWYFCPATASDAKKEGVPVRICWGCHCGFSMKNGLCLPLFVDLRHIPANQPSTAANQTTNGSVVVCPFSCK